MFYSISGTYLYSESDFAVVDCGGVAFKCFTTRTSLHSLPERGTNVTLYTYLHVREDALELYGFSSTEELNCFKLITGVSGVGTKIALAMLSTMSCENLTAALLAGDTKSITMTPGIGPKLAARMVLELKDKLKNSVLSENSSGVEASGTRQEGFGLHAEALPALMALGYSRGEAAGALSRCAVSGTVEEIIKQALRHLSK